MADTRFIPTQRSGRASMLGGAFGAGVGQGLEAIVSQMAQNKAEKIRAGHLKSLMPGASDEQVGALAHLGSSVYEPALRGGFGQEQVEKINPASPVSGSVGSGDFQAGPFFEMLSGFGLKMSPEQQKQLGALPADKQEQIARQVFERLSPQQQDHLENAIKQRTALSQEQMPQHDMQQQQPQQVIGSQQPGVAPVQPMQQPPKISLAESLRGSEGRSSLSSDLAREKFESVKEEKEQKRIKAENAPFVKQLEKEAPIAEKTLRLVNEMLELEDKGEAPGNIATQTIGAYAPNVVNPYAEYNAKSNEIAALKSQATGRPSVFMTQLQQSTKPNSSMPKEKRINLLNSLKENAEVILGLDEASREIIEQNNGKQIPNLKKYAEEKFFNSILPSPNEYEVNTEVEVYGEKFKNSPKGWVKVGRGK